MTNHKSPDHTHLRRSTKLGRREFLIGAGAACSAALLPVDTFAAGWDGLHVRAARKGLSFGCAVRNEQLGFPPMQAALLRDVGMIVPENSMKWRETQKIARAPNYILADRIADFAGNHHMDLRGHTVVWHQKPPGWAVETLDGPGGADLVLSYVKDIVGHFAGRVMEWDVLNEAIWTKDGHPFGIRTWAPYQAGGFDFMADCFIAAHEADPEAVLCYNDFGIEYDNQTDRRAAVLHLLKELKQRNAPVHCLGIQSHLTVGWNFQENIFREFLANVASLGVKIRLTELDVSSKQGFDIERLDLAMADVVRRYLAVCFDEKAVTGLLTWGLSDRFLTTRKDGTRPRALPLDDNFQPKPIWHAIAESFDNAPSR
jgi:endo-1,4-beta-xylanase